LPIFLPFTLVESKNAIITQAEIITAIQQTTPPTKLTPPSSSAPIAVGNSSAT